MIHKVALSLLILCSFTSCSNKLNEFPVQGEFEGIKTVLQNQNCVNVVMIHGMGGFSEGDPQTLKCAVVNCLRLRKTAPDCVREVIGELSGQPYYYGNLKREEYRDPCSSKTVRFYTIDWHPTVDTQKQRLIEMDKPMITCREKSIQTLKESVINNTTADTFLYFSSFRPEMEHPIIQSIRWIVEDSGNESETENLVVGYSMGGNLLINSVISMLYNKTDESNTKIAKTFIDDTAAVYYLSNGFPLAELVEDHPEKQYDYDDDQHCELAPDTRNLQEDVWHWNKSPLGLFVNEKRKNSPNFQIVSFNDPNDPFSYNASKYPVPNGSNTLNAFLNENVRNVQRATLGNVDPAEAHTGYGKNPKVIGLIINGLRSRNVCY